MEIIEKTDYRKASDETLYEIRKTVIRMYKAKKKTEEIMEATGLCRNTVYEIRRTYNAEGLAGLKPKTRGRKLGEKRTLTPAQEKELISKLVDHCPEQYKIKGCMWTRESVQEMIERLYGIKMPARTVGEYLHRWGFTVQRPAKQAMNQKPEQVQKWMEETYPEIAEEAKKDGAEIYWSDETAVQNCSNYARGYAPKGKTPVLKTQTRKMHINMVSAINNQGKVRFLLYSEAMDSDLLIGFMESLIKDAKRKVILILDNLRAHHSKKTQAWLESNNEKIKVYYLPPYSPERNPDEYLNHDLKQSLGSQIQAKDVSDIERNTRAFIEKLADNPDRVKSYFLHPKIKEYVKD